MPALYLDSEFPLLEFIYVCSRLTSTLWLMRKILSLAVFIKYFEFEGSIPLVHKTIKKPGRELEIGGSFVYPKSLLRCKNSNKLMGFSHGSGCLVSVPMKLTY